MSETEELRYEFAILIKNAHFAAVAHGLMGGKTKLQRFAHHSKFCELSVQSDLAKLAIELVGKFQFVVSHCADRRFSRDTQTHRCAPPIWIDSAPRTA